MINFKNILLVVLLAAPGLARAQSAQELDNTQAQLNQQMGRLDEITRVHGNYILIRDGRVNGPGGFYPDMSQWFTDTAGWVKRWDSVLLSIKGENLANAAQLGRVKIELQKRLEELTDLKKRADLTRAKGQTAINMLAPLRSFPENYIPQYGEAIKFLNQQPIALKKQLILSVSHFDKESIDTLEKIYLILDKIVDTKATALALRFPELDATVKEVKAALLAMKTVDREYYALQRLYDEIYTVMGSDEQPYKTQKLLAAFLVEGEAAKKRIQADISIPRSVKDNGVKRIGALSGSLEDYVRTQFLSDPAPIMFRRWYEATVLDPGGLRDQCLSSPPSYKIDCMLLKSYLIDPTKLAQFNDGQLRELEALIERVKQGPLH